MKKKHILIGISLVVIPIASIFIVYMLLGDSVQLGQSKGIEVEERLVMPETQFVGGAGGRTVAAGSFNAPLNPDAGQALISSKAVYSLKAAYDAAHTRARVWSDDAQLVFVHSMGVVTYEGTSGQWQVVFASKKKQRGYEIVVFGPDIVSEKEIPSDVFGYDLPNEWYDSGDALQSLRSQPQFAQATVSSINFLYNEDGKRWGYALNTSNGTVSMPVK